MSEELTSILRDLLVIQTPQGRCQVLAGLDRWILEALHTHFAGYDANLFPDGRINCALIKAALLECNHREQSLQVIEDWRAGHVL